MYGWLSDALRDNATVVTANRRLARVLRQHHGELQVAAGRLAWSSPEIHAWDDWLNVLLRTDAEPSSLPTLINEQQSGLLWERSLVTDIPAAGLGQARLVRLCRDAWRRASDWQVSIRDVARSAQTDDQRLFASVCGRYLGILEREHWADEASLNALVLDRIRRRRVRLPESLTMAGFNRMPPAVDAIVVALREAGVSVGAAAEPPNAANVQLYDFEDADAELRAAGAWARRRLDAEPGCRVAIIATGLEQATRQKARLVREGCVPGWQYAPRRYREAVNVSLGRALSEYPAIAIALLLLRWLVRDLSSTEVAQILRSPLIGSPDTSGRHQLELRLRDLPTRHWAPAMLSAELRACERIDGTDEWFRLISRFTRWRRELAAQRPPADWALFIDDVLGRTGWPGDAPLDSVDFQVVNRWRDLLNDLARLGLVSHMTDLPEALRRIETMAAETVFQAESRDAVVQLIGPLEAAGAEFDAVWISGLTAANWPGIGRASPLLSLRLQRGLGMPDADPADTVEFATTLLRRLGSAGREVVCSWARHSDDEEQTQSSLIDELKPRTSAPGLDVGWHSIALLDLCVAQDVVDNVPAVEEAETVAGGAATIQKQLTEPLSAFIAGRLGVRSLRPQASGLGPALRGVILHDALYRLYADLPARTDIVAWGPAERLRRINTAVLGALHRHRRHADRVLAQLFEFEGQRLAHLLSDFVAVELDRDDFSVAAIEHEIGFLEEGIGMTLRADRIDRLSDGSLAVLDYKSGARKRFVDGSGQPREFQLVAYTCAISEPVSALALVNIDSREIAFDGAGAGYGHEEDWESVLGEWKAIVRSACADMRRGDVRISARQTVLEARPLSLLSRYNELRRDGR